MELSDLVEGYELLLSTSQLDATYSDTGRIIRLYDDGFVRVYLTKDPEIWNDITLEIEIFMGIGRSPKSVQSERIGDAGNDVNLSRIQLVECISYIEYLLRLDEAGFNVDIVLDGCIWTARCLVKTKPDSQLFRTIIPPNHHDKRS